MILKLRLVKIDSNYCDYLREYDNKVPYNMNEKQTRPFIGVLFKIEKYEYFAPLSSPKEKHKNMKNTIDFLKINEGNLGAVNFNNMIPVTEKNYELIELNSKPLDVLDKKYKKLLNEQLRWLNANYNQVKNKSLKLYDMYKINKLPEKIRKRCCNFQLLEKYCNLYNKDGKDINM